MNRKSQLQTFIQKSAGSLSLLELEELGKELNKTFPKLPEEAPNWPKEERKLADKLMKDIVYKKLSVYKAYRYDWEAGRVLPNDEELKYLKNFSKNFSFIIKFFEEEKKQSPSNADGFEQVKKDSKEDEEVLNQLIKNDEYRRKAEEKLREENNKKKGGGNSSPPQLSETDKQIASLQGKIQVLEDKLKQTPASDNSDASQQQKKEIQQQIQQLKNELKEKEKEKTTQQDNNFPWKPVFIVGGGVIFILVVILLIKKIIKG